MPVIIGRVQFAPAKINLALHVTGRREDGYHLLETLAVFTRFGDRITIGSAERDAFSVAGPYASAVPTDETNLILKARDARMRQFLAAQGRLARADRHQLEQRLGWLHQVARRQRTRHHRHAGVPL